MTEEIKQNGLILSINKEKKTADIIGNESEANEIVIPRSIIHESNEYIIVNILRMSFMLSTIKSIRFAIDSEIRRIGSRAFYESKIESISIPSSYVKFEDGWSTGASKLTNIIVSPENRYYKAYSDNILILEKSSIEKENFDLVFWCKKNAQSVEIPNFIEIIRSDAFNLCKKLKRIEITSDSKLRKIERSAFLAASIECIKIPPNLIEICPFAFALCKKLSKIEIPSNSNLQAIGDNAFCNTSIGSIFIPSHVTQLNEHAFLCCKELCIIEIDENLNIKLVGKYAFYQFQNAIIMVPVKLSNFFQIKNILN